MLIFHDIQAIVYIYPSFRLSEILDAAEDLAIDIPKIWSYLAECIGKFKYICSVKSIFRLSRLTKTVLISFPNLEGVRRIQRCYFVYCVLSVSPRLYQVFWLCGTLDNAECFELHKLSVASIRTSSFSV